MRRGGWRTRTLARKLPVLIWLAVLWMLLWDEFSLGNLIAGFAIALVVTTTFYLPPVSLAGRLNLYWLAVFLLHFSIDVLRASWEVILVAIRPGPLPRSAVVAVQLATESDFILTLTSVALCLIPGSVVIEVDRRAGTLYVHVLDGSSAEKVDHAVHAVHAIEARLIKALGSPDDCAALAAATMEGRK